MSNEHVIQTWNLTKQYNGKAGCKDITLTVPRGVVYGFLGPNGAGKSTFVRTLLGLLKPTGGQAQILGMPLGTVETRGKIGYLPELFRYPEWLTGRQLLQTHADLCKIPRIEQKTQIDQLIERVGLTKSADDKIKGYSKGMQQRIGLAAALLSDPDLIFLDEPTSALDPIGRKEVRELMSELRAQGKTVFLNSHLLSEVETVCDHVAIIHRSELIVQGEWRKLSRIQSQVEISGYQIGAVLEGQQFPMIQHWEQRSTSGEYEAWHVTLDKDDSIPDLVQALSAAGARIYQVVRKEPHLEDVFLYWVNRKEQERSVDDRKVSL
ncbi:ABC transporter ATP-binding protein [Effusibacillus lacus]|uniref:Multidrug ABC transporter ATP-binding protein n=1 Tax=Effusibacillus lacus TaxID=1348429 RepID=A0A292YFA7_9BACL|nr:ABC transporter ATP-binding protein [Effusibacillus lacus]TCS74789.1 ABC-2 type transport system ATP-binding protein [Effusibacillus lacus]GAX88597.1 multidrug ABC transporter ATP-binding protein [Effusibacillus lacus]